MNAISKIKANATRANKGAAKSNAGWLGTPVLIPGEDAAAFDEFAERIRSALKPANAIEEIYVDDAIFHGWEVRRWRRAKAGLLIATGPAALKRVLGRLCAKPLAETLTEGWTKGDPAGVAKVESFLRDAGLSYDVVMGDAMALKIDVMEGFDALMGSAEERFRTALRELERYRAGTAQKVQDIVDAEFAEVARPTKGKGRHA